MTQKKENKLQEWYGYLERACRRAGHPATAGQVALVAGSSRSTAVKYLKWMESMGKCEAHTGQHVNGQPMTGYKPEGGW